RIRPELGPGRGALPQKTVALPTAVLDERFLAFLRRRRQRAAATEQDPDSDRRRSEHTNKMHHLISLGYPRARPVPTESGRALRFFSVACSCRRTGTHFAGTCSRSLSL